MLAAVRQPQIMANIVSGIENDAYDNHPAVVGFAVGAGDTEVHLLGFTALAVLAVLAVPAEQAGCPAKDGIDVAVLAQRCDLPRCLPSYNRNKREEESGDLVYNGRSPRLGRRPQFPVRQEKTVAIYVQAT